MEGCYQYHHKINTIRSFGSIVLPTLYKDSIISLNKTTSVYILIHEIYTHTHTTYIILLYMLNKIITILIYYILLWLLIKTNKHACLSVWLCLRLKFIMGLATQSFLFNSYYPSFTSLPNSFNLCNYTSNF